MLWHARLHGPGNVSRLQQAQGPSNLQKVSNTKLAWPGQTAEQLSYRMGRVKMLAMSVCVRSMLFSRPSCWLARLTAGLSLSMSEPVLDQLPAHCQAADAVQGQGQYGQQGQQGQQGGFGQQGQQGQRQVCLVTMTLCHGKLLPLWKHCRILDLHCSCLDLHSLQATCLHAATLHTGPPM